MAVAALRSSWPVLLLGGLALLEPVSAIFGGGFTRLASWSWVVLAVGSLSAAWYLILQRLWTAAKARHGMLLLVFLGGAWLTFGRLADTSSFPVNREATQQVAAGLEAWQKPDLGYHETAFLSGSYPTRQYLLLAIPAKLFGRELVPLRFGYALLFFTGWALFLVTLGQRWRGAEDVKAEQASPLPVLAALTVFTFPLVTHWLFNYEQTIVPLSLTLQTVAWAIDISVTGKRTRLIPLAWSAGMLGTCYSTGLTVWGLCLLLGGALVLFWRHAPVAKREVTRGQFAVTLAYVISMGVSTLWTMRLILPGKFTTRTIISEEPMATETFWQRVQEGFQALLHHPFFPFFHPFLALAFLLPLIVLVARKPSRATWVPTALWMWMIVTIVAAVTLRGYCHRPPPFDLHRAMVIVPFLILLAGDFWRSLLRARLELWTAPLRLFAVALGAIAVIQANDIRDPASYQPYKSDTEAGFLKQVLSFRNQLEQKETTPCTIWVDHTLPTCAGFHEYLGYFFPGATFRRERPNLEELEKTGQPFAALVRDGEEEHRALLNARLSAEVLPGAPQLPHLPKQYLMVFQRSGTVIVP
ncbi:MAG TPA: hypothetical protein PLN52_02325 [Opitutaceae bacterium]|nr:hypothetical protein [Opitutaceae bacterium]